jgi:two-component system, OmpR family, response regulator
MRSSLLRESLPDHAMIPGGARLPTWPTLLVVDPDREMLQTLVCYFEKRGFHVAASTNIGDAKSFFHRRKTWTLVMADYHLPDGSGLEFCCWVREQNAMDTPVLLMSGNAQCALLCAGVEFLAKPFPLEALESRVRLLLRRPES